tara:strand:- start:543 stop:665 length:123 start_codon:yes stop_codon:yes gene_type:complete
MVEVNSLLTQLLNLNKEQLAVVEFEVRVALMEMEMGEEDE